MTQFETNDSVFNMAMAYLQRIDRLLYKTQDAAQAHNIDEWLNYLYAVRRELSVKLEEKEEEELRTMFVEVKILVNNPKTKLINKGKILGMLDEIDIYMRKKLQQRGMLLPNRKDPRFAILER